MDVDQIHAYIWADNPGAAERVQEAIFDAFDLLARNPRLGRTRRLNQQKSLRSWVVTEYPSHIIFYRDLAGGPGVEIIRVLHGARDLETLLDS